MFLSSKNPQRYPQESVDSPFLGCPISEVEHSWRCHAAQNLRPETHPGVRLSTDPLPDGMPFTIIDRVSISAFWADQSRIHCNACTTSRKFKDGGFVALGEDGWLYLLGPQCGSSEYRSRLNEARRVYERKEIAKATEGRFLDLLEKLDEWRERYKELIQTADDLVEKLRNLKIYHPASFAELLKAVRNENVLPLKSGGVFAVMSGLDFLVSEEQILNSKKTARETLRLFLSGDKNADDVLLMMKGALKEDRLYKLIELFERGARALDAIEACADQRLRLATEVNFSILEEYGRHPDRALDLRFEQRERKGSLHYRFIQESWTWYRMPLFG